MVNLCLLFFCQAIYTPPLIHHEVMRVRIELHLSQHRYLSDYKPIFNDKLSLIWLHSLPKLLHLASITIKKDWYAQSLKLILRRILLLDSGFFTGRASFTSLGSPSEHARMNLFLSWELHRAERGKSLKSTLGWARQDETSERIEIEEMQAQHSWERTVKEPHAGAAKVVDRLHLMLELR